MKKTNKTTDKVKEIVDNYTTDESFKIDPNGSWTGVCEDKREKPVQDADDL